MQTKLCTSCNEDKPLSEYNKNRGKKNGLNHFCNACRREKAQALKTSRQNANQVADSQECVTCKETKSADKFYIDFHRRSGLSPNCRRCHVMRQTLRNYDMTLAQYNAMMKQQQNLCGICKREFCEDLKPHVDHCHKTGVVRGFLCGGCNTAIGSLREDIPALENAIIYLRNHATR